MKICIYGAGAMGTSLGVLLTQAGEDPLLVTRNRAHVEALNRAGATIVCGKKRTVTSVRAALPSETNGPFDLIFLATRQRDNAQTAEKMFQLLANRGAVVTVQNGLPERTLAERLGAETLYGCALSWGAEQVRAGEVAVTSDSGYRFALGACGTGKRLEEIAALLRRVGQVTVGKLNEIRYAKLAVNASFSTLSAISALPFGKIASRHTRLALALMREVFAVARTEGCERLPLNGHDLFRVFSGAQARVLLPLAMKRYRNTRSGMLKDLEAGRRCDVDFVAGAAVRRGRELGVPVPLLARAVGLVHDIENGFAELSAESLRLLVDQ